MTQWRINCGQKQPEGHQDTSGNQGQGNNRTLLTLPLSCLPSANSRKWRAIARSRIAQSLQPSLNICRRWVLLPSLNPPGQLGRRKRSPSVTGLPRLTLLKPLGKNWVVRSRRLLSRNASSEPLTTRLKQQRRALDESSRQKRNGA